MDGSDPEGLARDYVALGLRLGRVVPGLVDAHVGDPALARRVDDEPAGDPAVLRREAAALRRRLDDGSLDPARTAYLAAQLAACEVIAARAAGEEVDVVTEIRECLGVDVGPGDPDAYREAHAGLAEVLGTTTARLPGALAAFRDRDRVAPELLRPGLAAMTAALRERTRAAVGLPPDERVELEIVAGVPWAGFAHRTGPGRSVVQVSRDAGHRRAHLPLLAAHEAYPGHHTEMSRTEARPAAPERTLFLARTPQSLVAEGAAETGLAAVVGTGWGVWAADHLAAAGVPTTAGEGALGEAVEEAMLPLGGVRQDAALLLHGSTAADREERARAHLRRWLLIDDERAGRMLGFLGHPRWRIHTTTYVEGTALARAWLAARPEGEPAGPHFARLLDEPWTPDRLRHAASTTAGVSDTQSDTPGERGERYPGSVGPSPMSPTV
ncbi:DUF885 domain-containing protein [Actinomycetospora sp. TBRC 11914]|uniref:DUF885 domain-containing protein n=1 Tax=Actinomycetospora sp. TBRC 11914 TaxID=2729387 RepID=UPI00145E2B77|nr:DUF885 domain-containing protein [Actinomycetospora sp. TBRC 11914]NMO88874.1 DUF885 domain-containing protein [Actinomycetospora sp. TBRC 11914]